MKICKKNLYVSFLFWVSIYGPQREKNCLGGFHSGQTKTSLLSYID